MYLCLRTFIQTAFEVSFPFRMYCVVLIFLKDIMQAILVPIFDRYNNLFLVKIAVFLSKLVLHTNFSKLFVAYLQHCNIKVMASIAFYA